MGDGHTLGDTSSETSGGTAGGRARVGVIVPIKAFEEAKERLSPALNGEQRIQLARQMAATVIAAAQPLPVFVVCGDETVAAWSDDQDAEVLWFPKPGLNAAVSFAADQLERKGFDRVAIAHGDLPLATELAPFVVPTSQDDPRTVMIVRDRRADGTNVLSLPTGSGFVFGYGAGSAGAHQSEAKRLGLPVKIVDDEKLGWDVDVPEDLPQGSFGTVETA